MFSWWLILLVSIAYVALLFAIAHFGDKPASARLTRRFQPLIYSLTLGVYCTSWTFYGAVGTAARTGWGYLPIYLGPILTVLFGWTLIQRIVAISKSQNLTSIADFIAARYGKGRTLAVLVTLLAVAGSVPYIALQLKAVASGFDIVSDQARGGFIINDASLLFAGLLALFAILFGTRQIDASEHHRGMMLAIAFESLVKLLAFAAVGVFAFLWLLDAPATTTEQASAASAGLFSLTSLPDAFITQTLLAAAAIFCLPRQFHVIAVEADADADLRPARWMFPIYLLIFIIFVLPITYAGLTLLPGGVFAGDTFVLALPMSKGHNVLTALAFLGGFSAATGMVIVASVTLSTMVSNEIVMPSLFSIKRLGLDDHRDYSALLLQIRRAVIVAIIGAAYIYYQIVDRSAVLASIGLLSFAAAAQFAPPIILGMVWPNANRRGAVAGLSTGFALWLYTLFVPSMAHFGVPGLGFVETGLFGQAWLRPEALLIDVGIHPLSHGVLWSLLGNFLVLVVVSRFTRRSMSERIAAGTFVVKSAGSPADRGINVKHIVNADLSALAERIVGKETAQRSLSDFSAENNISLDPHASADRQLIRFTERLLAGAVGTSSARVIITAALRQRGMGIGDVVLLLDETSQAIQFNRQLLEATLANMSQGVSVIDASQRLIGWNASYLAMMQYPHELVYVGKPIRELLEYNASSGHFHGKNADQEIDKRLSFLRIGSPYRYESEFPDGRVVEIRGQPMPDGGYVTTFSDISEAKAIESALRDSEKRVRGYTDNLPAMIAYLDASRYLRFANKTYADYMRLPREDIIGRPLCDVLNAEALMSRQRYLDAAFAGESQVFEIEVTDPEGAQRYMLGNYVPDVDTNGQVFGIYANFQDITARRQAELALFEAKEHLEQRVRDRTKELEHTLEALRIAKGAADEAHTSKTRFFAAAAHDLLQPINAAKLFTALLADSSGELPSEQRLLVSRIESGLVAVEDLLNALLEIAHLDAGTHTPEPRAVALQTLFEKLETQFSQSCRERGLKLHFVPSRAVIYTDPALLRRILQNFIGNAQRYTLAGGVVVGGRRRGESLAICVYDTGIGIAAQDQRRVFGEFARLSNNNAGTERGIGLGLAIVKRIARLLGHRIAMRSIPGRGSCFEVQVPLTDAPASVATPVPSGAATSIQTVLGPQHVVLCVDNERDILDGMQALLSRWGLTTFTAHDIDAAEHELTQIREQQKVWPSLLLVDYQLDNNRTGLEVVARLRELSGEDIPAAVLTADRAPQVRDEVEKAGLRLLYKPIKPAALRALITRMVSKPRAA